MVHGETFKTDETRRGKGAGLGSTRGVLPDLDAHVNLSA
jgi:hypothetical protein